MIRTGHLSLLSKDIPHDKVMRCGHEKETPEKLDTEASLMAQARIHLLNHTTPISFEKVTVEAQSRTKIVL